MTQTDGNPHPSDLPPGFRALPGGASPWDAALRAAAADAEPGTMFWSGAGGRCEAAFVFSPDRPLEGPGVVLSLGALALYDTLAVFAPPNRPLHILPPDGLVVNAGRAAALRAAVAPAEAGAVPEWAVLGLDVALDLQTPAPGDTPDETCLAEEGFGAVAPAELLAQLCRYLLFWINVWQDEGGVALSKAVADRTASPVAA